MDALDRFAYHQKRFRKRLGSRALSQEAARHLAHAAEIEQGRHEIDAAGAMQRTGELSFLARC